MSANDLKDDIVELDLGKTHYRLYERDESERLVICLHGLSLGCTSFNALFDHLSTSTALAPTILMYDYFGRGSSELLSVDEHEYDAQLHVVQLAQLLRALNLLDVRERNHNSKGKFKNVCLIGYSMGGALTCLFARDYPHCVDEMILLAPAGMSNSIGVLGKLATAPYIGDWLMAAVGVKQMRGGFRSEFVDVGDERERSIAQIEADYDAQTARTDGQFIHAVLSCLRHFPLFDLDDAWRAVAGDKRRRVLICWGTMDTVVPYDTTAPRFKRLFDGSNAQFVEFERCAHAILHQHRARLHSIVDEFLEASNGREAAE
jgi:pimeloyl-ACP methyl ester carboxylesterase